MLRPGRIISSFLAAILGLAALCGPVLAGHPDSPIDYALVTEPGQGLAPIYGLISSARSSIDMTMYELLDPTVISLLEKAAGQGVAVRVILDQNDKQEANTPAHDQLAANGVAVHWANPAYACTHQKTLTVDGTASAVMTLNFTPEYYPTSRDFGVITNSAADVAAIETTFAADFTDLPVTPPAGDGLVWSPTNAQASLLSLIGSAGSNLLVENEEMSDGAIVDALCAAAGRGVGVRIAMTNRGKYAREFTRLRDAGAGLALYPDTAELYIHAKVVLADYGTPGARVFIGSENFSEASLTRNRELGLILSDPAVMDSINATLSADFAGGQPYPQRWPVSGPGCSD
jgi:phosphatidylserine/phosphatidylglycerophosphate/cardiolipin synthase-like enzyme